MSHIKITEQFDGQLAALLAEKIEAVYPSFDSKAFIRAVEQAVPGKRYTQRVEAIADCLHEYLPDDFEQSAALLVSILGPENPNETGMFSEYYWILPIGKYIEKQGLAHFDTAMQAIGEVTKRNTGEYALRPFIRKYPQKALKQMTAWAQSNSFHLRRLASEGLRPKLPWATKLDTFIEKPQPVFDILELLKEDEVRFVQRSVGNHLTDWLKVNPEPTWQLIERWEASDNSYTQWIIKRATRKIKR